MKPTSRLLFTVGLIKASTVFPLQGATPIQSTPNKDKPNVIIIYSDDVGYGDIQCYGAKNVETPALNKLASQGLRLTNAHAVAATSTPSRYSLLTGEYAWRRKDTDVAAGNAGMIIRPHQFTMADMFKSAGYQTGAIGKWHLGLGEKTGEQDWNAPLATGLADLGFDYHYIMAATADRVPCVFIENGFIANYDEKAPIYVSYKENFPNEPTGKKNPELLYNLHPSHGHDMSIVNGISRIGYMKGGGKALWNDENIADSITSHALRFIEENQHHPFFLYVATNDIHVPRFPHPRFRGKSGMGLRGDAIAELDWTVGQITDKLEQLGLSENTLVIFSSDNGPVVDDGYLDQSEELLNGHSPTGGLRGNKYSAFEGGTRVPAIICWPARIKSGSVSDALVSQIDWMKSLGTLINARFPQGSASDSQNYLNSLLAKNAKGRDWVVELSSSHVLSIREKEWKYIPPNKGPKMVTFGPKVETGNSPEEQLYHLSSDEKETKNVAKSFPEQCVRLRTILDELQ